MMWWWHGSGWGWITMMLVMFAFWGLVIWAVVAVARSGRPTAASSDPEAVLARRFAAGEIDEDDYRARLATLRASHVEPVGHFRRDRS
jgi:putative membrane protein